MNASYTTYEMLRKLYAYKVPQKPMTFCDFMIPSVQLLAKQVVALDLLLSELYQIKISIKAILSCSIICIFDNCWQYSEVNANNSWILCFT